MAITPFKVTDFGNKNEHSTIMDAGYKRSEEFQ